MNTSKLVYINLALLATSILVYSSSEPRGERDDGRIRTVYISAEAPGSVAGDSVAQMLGQQCAAGGFDLSLLRQQYAAGDSVA